MANYDSFLFIGHGKSEKTGAYDPGAVYNNHKENDIAKAIVNAAMKYLKATKLNIHVDENNYADNDILGNTYKYQCGLSIHINAGKGTGPEIFVPCAEKKLDADFLIVDEISKLLKISNRGVKSRDYTTGTTFARKNGVALNYKDYYKEIREAWVKGISLSILEVGFIDTSDLAKILERIDEIGYLVARYIAKVCLTELNKPTTPAPAPNVMYRVVTGSFSDRANAEKRILELEKAGFKSFLDVYKK